MKRVIILAVIAIFAISCSDLSTAPVQVSVRLDWTAPGDDGVMGQATQYDGRYSTSTDSLTNHWDACLTWPTPSPAYGNTPDSADFSLDVETGVMYHFSLKAVDEVGNWALISNISSEIWADTIPPSPINDLR